SSEVAVYQRPEMSTKILPLLSSRTTLLSVFAIYRRSPLPSVCHEGTPSVQTSSVGSVATMMLGGFAGRGVEDVSAGTSLAMSTGGLSMEVHGPLGSFALYQSFPPL